MYTNVPLQSGRSYTLKELYESSLVCSANASAMAIGNYLAKDGTDFGEMMTDATNKLGIKDQQFYNACGLSNGSLGPALMNPQVGAAQENRMSAAALAQFTQKLLAEYPEILKTTAKPYLVFDGETYPTTDGLLGIKGDFVFDGLKTGTSDTAGENFVGTAKKDDLRLITVILGSENEERFNQSWELVNQIDQRLDPVTINDQMLPIQQVRVPNGQHEFSKFKVQNNKTYWFPNQPKIHTKFVNPNGTSHFKALLAPIKKNEVIGQLQISNLKDIKLLPDNTSEVPVEVDANNEINWQKMILGFSEILLILLGGFLLVKFVWLWKRR